MSFSGLFTYVTFSLAVAIGTDFQHVMFNIKSSELSDISHNYHGNCARDLDVMLVKIMSMAFACMSVSIKFWRKYCRFRSTGLKVWYTHGI